MARRAVQTVVEQSTPQLHVDLKSRRCRRRHRIQLAAENSPRSQPRAAKQSPRRSISFCMWPVAAESFPVVLGNRIFVTRQEIIFFGVPPGDTRFQPPAMPTWLFLRDEFYGMPDLENRGFKVQTIATEPSLIQTRNRASPPPQHSQPHNNLSRAASCSETYVVETRVCQYENTSNGDF